MLYTEYCVILCRRPFEFYQPYPRTRRFYVGAPTAGDAILTASDRHPEYRPIGIELSDLPAERKGKQPTYALLMGCSDTTSY
jgi:hypothetical protein